MGRRSLRGASLAVVVGACASAGMPPAVEPAPSPAPARARSTAAAALAIDNRERHYAITGSSVAELADAMRRLGPRESGTPADALTEWDLESSYREGTTPGNCALREVRVRLTVTVTLPRWDPPGDAPARLIASWRRFLEHVTIHEAGHRAIAEQSAHDLAAALTALRGRVCDDVFDEAGRTATRVVERGRAKNRAYDVETAHGQTQGVELVP
jgi:predicted secreted Zn-dependent protease